MTQDQQYLADVERKAREIDPESFVTDDPGFGTFSRRKVMRQIVAKMRARHALGQGTADYDPAQNARDSYALAIRTIRDKITKDKG
jgi:hypothetical protein